MDKYEYKLSVDEIKRLIKAGDYQTAVEIADTIDWRRVKSVMMLCTISDLYKINRRYEDARDVLLLAYDQRPNGRTICYSLCELCLKTGQLVPAMEYFKQFVQIAPNDPGRYILQYKIYQSQGGSLEERILLLEELKKKDYREKWAYELANLYYENGDITKCVDECDELILWFGEGKYVIKAMELKMRHQPLTEEQQYRYDHRFDQAAVTAPVQEKEITPDDVLVKTVDVSQYNTMNLQEELAAGVKELMEREAVRKQDTKEIPTEEILPEVTEVTDEQPVPEVTPKQEVAEEKADTSTKIWGKDEIIQKITELKNQNNQVMEEAIQETRNNPETNALTAMQEELEAFKISAREKMAVDTLQRDVLLSQPPHEMAKVLAQESDGQISLVVPEAEKVEKQITGQIRIEEVLAEWEEKKKRNQDQHEEQIRQKVLKDTGDLFAEFEQAVKDGLLERLEREPLDSEEELAKKQEEKTEETLEISTTESALPEQEDDGEVEYEEITDPVSEDGKETREAEEVETEEATEAVEMEEIAETEETTEAVEMEEIAETEETTEAVEVVETEETIEAEIVVEEELDKEKILSQEEELVNEVTQHLSDKEGDDTTAAKQPVRSFTKEEKDLFAPFIQTKTSREQVLNAMDKISIASYTGNVIITGVAGTDTLSLAKALIKEEQAIDSNFTGESAKISGENLNKKDVAETIERYKNGALIIEKATGLNDCTVNKLYQCLQKEETGIVIFLIDTKKKMNHFLEDHEQFKTLFNIRIDLEAMSNEALVNFGYKYALEKEYSIDKNMGMLAFHTRIDNLQTGDHSVTVLEVREIVDEAIAHVNRKTVGHFFDILFGRRYDEEDRIILSEKDFAEK